MSVKELVKHVPIDRPASQVPVVVSRRHKVQRELDALTLQMPERALACAQGKPGAREALAELQAKLALARFEMECSGKAQDLAVKVDQEMLAAWKADVQALPPESIIEGIGRDDCCRRCLPGDCIMAGSDSIRSECIHPVLAGPLNLLRHKNNPHTVAVHRAAVAKVGTRR